jgi:hypothetical protein
LTGISDGLRRGVSLRRPAFAFLFIAFSSVLLSAQEADEANSRVLTAAQLLSDAVLFNCDVTVTMPGGEADPWSTAVRKITIPGRPVTVGLENDGSRLEVHFTLYPAEEDSFFLVAKSETWTDESYSSGLSSMRMEFDGKVLYYPLGRAEEGEEGNPVEILMAINIVPYLETLDDEARASLESAFDSSALFDLSGEGG